MEQNSSLQDILYGTNYSFESREQSSLVRVIDESVTFCTPIKVMNETSKAIAPEVGMCFDSVEEFEEFYNAYNLANRFHIRKRTSRGNDYFRWVCRKAGFHKAKATDGNSLEKKKRKTSTVRVGCLSALSLKFDKQSGKWVIYSFTAEHNHGIVTPNKEHYVPTGVTVEESSGKVIEMFKDHGIPIGKVAELFGKGRFSKRNCYNHMRDVRSKILDIGDAQGVLEYCEHQLELDPRFFYRMQIDEKGRMSNFLWIDARSRMAYGIFGDAIIFDTTYRTNKYEMPLAPFTGVNNHKGNILFGCALIMDEHQDTFEWLFRTWLEAMDGKAPISIITDQDKSISNAVRAVFPKTRHKFCIWHILKKFLEKLPPALKVNKVFKREISDVIQKSLSTSHFENQWLELMVRYDLQDNKWFKKMFLIREEWIPIFTVDTFFAGMQASQRAESMNALFSGKVNGGTTLQEFVRQYEIVLEERYEIMRREDYESRHKTRICDRNSFLEEHAAEVYTRAMYLEFYSQIAEAERYRVFRLEDYTGPGEKYLVRHGSDCNEFYDVHLDMKSIHEGTINFVTCSCGYFVWNGLLCRHILKVFNSHSVIRIPDAYILHRWCKDASRPLDVFTPLNTEEKSEVVRRVLHLKHFGDEVASLACKDEGKYCLACMMYEEGIKRLVESGEEALDVSVVVSNPIRQECESIPSKHMLLNPNISQTKGRKKDNKRIKSSLEVATSGQRRCDICRGAGHNASTCKKKKVDENSTMDQVAEEAP